MCSECGIDDCTCIEIIELPNCNQLDIEIEDNCDNVTVDNQECGYELRAEYVETEAGDKYSYTGTASNGSLETDSVWKITRIQHFLDGTVEIKIKYNVKWSDYLTIVF